MEKIGKRMGGNFNGVAEERATHCDCNGRAVHVHKSSEHNRPAASKEMCPEREVYYEAKHKKSERKRELDR